MQEIVKVVTAYMKSQNQMVVFAEHNEGTCEWSVIPSERLVQLVGMLRR